MNIEQAKTEIRKTVEIYLMKDEYGNYRLDPQNQRPVFMIGAPGIGKTACVAQVAGETGLPLVSYTMTHHTRQSAIGLPLIQHRTYQGEEFDVSVYTLSEIIASVYEAMESSGQKEGILFLDEINCVSETLAPAMLQFLQYKTFGNHSLPEGWIIVAAGNPHEFNRNARDFDIATLDRLKILNVEPDYQAWKKYADSMAIHPSILSYLDLHPDDIFHVETSVDGKRYVTPRGWEDLSRAMLLYEEKQFPVDETLICQYLHDERIVNSFVSYLTLYAGYRKVYPVEEILNGNVSDDIGNRMKQAAWDEKISVTDLLLNSLGNAIQTEQDLEESLKQLRDPLRALKDSENLSIDIATLYQSMKQEYHQNLSPSKNRTLDFLRKNLSVTDYPEMQKAYGEEVTEMNDQITSIEDSLHHCFSFLKEYGGEQTVLIAVTYLTSDNNAASFIRTHGCEDYCRYSEELSITRRNNELTQEINAYRHEQG